MPRRTTPRPKEEARAIVRALRARYITPEAEAAAKAAFARTTVPLPTAALKPPEPAPSTEGVEGSSFLAMIRQREGIADGSPVATGDFTEDEQSRARKILAEIQMRFATRQ